MKFFRDMSHDEIIELCEDNYNLLQDLQEMAYDYFTTPEICDFFRDSPRCIEDVSRNSYIQLVYNSNWYSYESLESVIDWIKKKISEGTLYIEDDNGIIDKTAEYIKVGHDDCYGIIHCKRKDIQKVDEMISENITKLLDFVSEYLNQFVIDQFDDIPYMVDALHGNEYLNDYYVDDDMNVWEIREPRKVA